MLVDMRLSHDSRARPELPVGGIFDGRCHGVGRRIVLRRQYLAANDVSRLIQNVEPIISHRGYKLGFCRQFIKADDFFKWKKCLGM